MPRQHIINSWVGACEYPDGDQYSGEQIGNRHKPSIEVKIERSGDRWRTVGVDQHFTKTGAANIRAYADEPAKPRRQAKKKSAYEQADLANRHYERLEQLSIQLDEELEAGEITLAQWTSARKQLDKRLERAWKRVVDANSWEYDENFDHQYDENLKNPVDNRVQEGLSFFHSVVEGLSEENSLKNPLKKMLTAKDKATKILNTVKAIWNERNDH